MTVEQQETGPKLSDNASYETIRLSRTDLVQCPNASSQSPASKQIAKCIHKHAAQLVFLQQTDTKLTIEQTKKIVLSRMARILSVMVDLGVSSSV